VTNQRDALQSDILVKTELVSLHALPPRLTDNTGADDHIILQRHSRGKGTDGMLKPPILTVRDNENVYIRPGLAIAASF
jgi:hypothetical protein